MSKVPGCALIGGGCLLQLIGSIAFGFLIFNGVTDIGKAGNRVVVPGSMPLQLEKAGDYTIFYEHQSVIDGMVYSTPQSLTGLQVELTGPDGNAITLEPSSGGTYNVGQRSGNGLFDFKAAQPGTYTLNAGYPDGSTEPRVVLAVMQGFMRKLMGLIGGGFLLLFGSLMIGFILMIVGIVLLVKSRRQAAAT